VKKKIFYTTRPNFFSYLYFFIIYISVIIIGKFNEKKTILDFGSGLGYLKKINLKLKNPSKIINYDKIQQLSEIKRWDQAKFNKIIFCQSAYMLSKKELNQILIKTKKKNINAEIITAFSTRSFINKIMSILLGHSDAYTGSKLSPMQEEKIFLKHCKVIRKFNFLNLFKVYLFKFK
jgi:hypothetical protein|tara:strand:- start:54 stop:584 length:531 start_codon:yes stop_codon:yes gene_type:complete